MRRAGFLLLLLPLFFAAVSQRSGAAKPAQDSSALPPAASVVKPHAFVSLDPVPREREFEVAVVVDILQGFHMNAHKPSEEFLIPTTLTPQLPPGFREIETVYPEGRDLKFSFSPDKPLAVYSGSVTLKMKLEAGAVAPLGEVSLPLVLRYQACNDTTCLPPVKVPVTVKLRVASAGAKAVPMHPSIFAAHATNN
jgi:thiol:disulfide interchange protein DsbD